MQYESTSDRDYVSTYRFKQALSVDALGACTRIARQSGDSLTRAHTQRS
jgi:hypothetical protein